MVSRRILKLQILFFFSCFGCVFGEEVIEEDDKPTAGLNVTFSPKCSQDFWEVVRGVLSAEIWALKIVDSMEKFPSGLLLGRSTAFGQIEECLSVVHPNLSTKYCTVELVMKGRTLNMTQRVRQSALARLRFLQFGYGACMPSSCNAEDFENAATFLGINNIITTKLDENSCLSKLNQELRPKDYFAIAVFSSLLILAVASTAYEVYTSGRKTDQSEILKSFSLQSNLKSLFETSNNPQDIDSVYGIRFFSFTWLVLGHLYAGVAGSINIVNPLQMIQTIGQESHIVGTNAFLCVDTFFFLSGFLVCLLFFRSISKTGSFDFFVSLIHRYLRLTPSFAALLLFNATLLSRLTNGAFAEREFDHMESDCSKNWWSYLLYIQNPRHKGRDYCFVAAWYLCADMQMYLLSPLILYVLLLKPKVAPLFLAVLALATTSASFISSYVEGVAPNPTFQNMWENKAIYTHEYFLFITRMTPWIVGLATGYILCGIKDKKISFQPSRCWTIIGWLIAAGLGLFSLYGIGMFYPLLSTKKTHPLPTSCYRSMHRLTWALSLSWVVLASVNNCGGVINKFLSSQIFKPLGKLTYCAYLNHLSVIFYRYLNNKYTLKHYTTQELIYTYMGDVFTSLSIALPMTLLIEMPFARIERILLKNMVIFPYPKSKKTDPNDPFTKEIDKEKNNAIKNDKTVWIVEESKSTME